MTRVSSPMCVSWPCLSLAVRLRTSHLVSPFLCLLMDILSSFLSSAEATRDPRQALARVLGVVGVLAFGTPLKEKAEP